MPDFPLEDTFPIVEYLAINTEYVTGMKNQAYRPGTGQSILQNFGKNFADASGVKHPVCVASSLTNSFLSIWKRLVFRLTSINMSYLLQRSINIYKSIFHFVTLILHYELDVHSSAMLNLLLMHLVKIRVFKNLEGILFSN